MEDKLFVTAHSVFQKITFLCEAAPALPCKGLFHYVKSWW
jgi:hypothetical protein